MSLSDVFIRRPVFTTMLSVLLMVLGVIGLGRLGTDLFPDVAFPFVSVTTVYPGAGPLEIEQQIVKPLEDAISGISGVETVQSFSRENVGLVFVQFKLTMELEKAVQEVRDKVGRVQQLLPKEAQVPRVEKVDLGAAPILTFAVSADLPTSELKRLITDRLEPALSQIDGVAQVRVRGGDVREVRVDVDLDKAKAAGIAPAQVAERIGMENIDVPAGRMELGPTELGVRALGQFRSVDDIRSLPILRGQTGAQVRLEEVAAVTDALAERRQVARLNGADSIIVEIIKRPGSNTVEVSKAAQAQMNEVGPTLGHSFQASVLIDNAIFIEANAHEVWIALLFGGLMAIIIILLFLLDPRGTFISGLALPTSVIGTFFVMYVLDYTLNQMTLLALSLAIGLLIDDAVVVREAITHRLEQGESPYHAASRGTQDVYLAVLATTLSLVAVFVPVAFMPGIIGQFFKQFGITMSAAVLISLFVSFTLDPMLSARLAKQRKPGEAHKENAVAGFLRRGFEGLEHLYARILQWTLVHRWATGFITLAVIGGSLFMSRNLGNEFMTPEDRSQFMLELTLPTGTSLSETLTLAKVAEAQVSSFDDVQHIYTLAGEDGFNGTVNKARLRVLVKPRTERRIALPALQQQAKAKVLEALPQTALVAVLDPPVIEGLGDFFPIMLYVTGPEIEGLEREAGRIATLMKGMKGLTDVRVVSNPPTPQLSVAIDRTRAGDTGLTSAMLGMQLRLAMNGQTAGKLREGSAETDIVVRLREQDRASPEQLKTMGIFTPAGVRDLRDVAKVGSTNAPSTIEHFNRQRRVQVLANMEAGTDLGSISKELKRRLASKEEGLPPGFGVFYDGQIKSLDEQQEAFSFAGLLALVFTYMVLASQFESFKHPFTIMVSMVLGLVGGLLALVVGGFSLTLGGSIGFILLMGLVTKNAILLVDQALQNLRAGDDLNTALVKAGPRRLRPILMTSAAMAIGMVPTAVGRGQGFEFRAPMAVAVIGGVITSTFLTLLVVPLVFAVLEKLTPKRFRIGQSTLTASEAGTPSASPPPAPSPAAAALSAAVPSPVQPTEGT